MSTVLATLAFIVTMNPPRTRLGLPETATKRARGDIVPAGIVVGVAVLALVGAAAGSVLDSLEISPESFRIAAGVVLVIAAAWMFFQPVPRPEPVGRGLWGALWPVAYPRIVSPETLTLAVTVGASDGMGRLLAGLAAAAAILLALSAVPATSFSRRYLAELGRVAAVALAVAGVGLLLLGVREV